MPTGYVKRFNRQKGFGFIQPDSGGKEVFVHISDVERAGLSTLNEGEAIEYDLNHSRRGRINAINLKSR